MSNHATKSIKSVIGFLASLLLLLTGVAGCGASSQDSISGEAKPTNPRGASGQKPMTSDSALRKTIKLNSGYEMPMLGLGTWTLSNDVAEESAYFAIKNGYRLIDTARYYGNEIGVGRGVRRAIDEGIVSREEIFVTSKIMPGDYQRPDAAIDDSMARLGLGYIDLMLIHQPGRGEILLTVLSSLSQEEARSISENVTWGVRKKMADGKFSVPFSRFLGYDRGEDGGLIINEDEAQTVRLIFRLYLEGLSSYAIAKELTGRGILTVTGKEKWNAATINGVLGNEKYTGNARLQKTFTPDFLTKKAVKNTGQVPSYYVENSHPAIIEPAVFDMVQAEMARRTKCGRRYSGVSIFSGKIKCGECGGFFGSKVWHSTDKYRRVIYRCNNKYGGKKCRTRHVTEEDVKVAFVAAFNRLVGEKDEMIANAKTVRSTICATEDLERERSALTEELTVVVKMVEECVAQNARIAQNQAEYQERYNGLVGRYEKTKARLDEVMESIAAKEIQRERLTGFIRTLERQGTIAEFDEGLWSSMVECVTVGADGVLTVEFRDGTRA
ncbi:aldo/keto reductase [Selenomonas ruminantium]|uniref:aldo/keto reductase n=1 Tax=Selenomonas ruminantium TaxID=971 RepID=UPI0009448615|nr:aldo/keto reductase [Selenomonas ruminantium]